MNVKLSRALAVVFGIALPALGVVRNWTLPNGDVAGFLVDLATGALLLFGAWKVGEKERTGQRFLAAAWGLTIGLFYSSLANQISQMWSGEAVEAPISQEWTVVATSVGLILAIVGLISGLRSTRNY